MTESDDSPSPSGNKDTTRTYEDAGHAMTEGQDAAGGAGGGWADEPPYAPASQRPGFVARRRASCHCGRVKYSLGRERPLASKFCHCRGCQVLHGAPFQWAAIFHKSDVAFDRGAEGLSFYRSSTCSAAHHLPCKVRCAHCGAPIMDEGRNMALVFPTLVEFRSGAERQLFEPQCHLFYSQRVVDMPDGATKWAGLDGKSERL